MNSRAATDGLLEQAIRYALRSVDGVSPGLLTRPTPCAGWDLSRLLEHTCESLAALTEGTCLGWVGPEPASADGPCTDAVAAFTARASSLLDAWPRFSRVWILIGDQRLAVADFAAAGALEIAVHGWDVACACGQPRPIPAPLASRLLALAPLLVSDGERARQPGSGISAGPLFGPPVTAPPRASASDRLTAFLGRTCPPRQPE